MLMTYLQKILICVPLIASISLSNAEQVPPRPAAQVDDGKMRELGPAPTDAQMRAFQKGDIEELSRFIGSANTVVLASKYKAQWEMLDYKGRGKCILRSYYRIVLSKDPAWQTGDVVVILNYIEDFNSIPNLIIKKWENPSGELSYLFNLRKSQASDSGACPECVVDRSCSVLEKNKRNYQTLWATLNPKE